MKALVPVVLLVAVVLGSGHAHAQAIDPSRYAAIAFSPRTGAFGYGWDHPSRALAERSALRNCRVDDARILTWTRFGYIVLLIAADGAHGYAEVHGDGARAQDAYDRALANLRKRTTSPVKTFVRVCSGNVEPVVLRPND